MDTSSPIRALIIICKEIFIFFVNLISIDRSYW